ncbi:MAG TPA: hypothetical protein VFC46_05930, partial [Humisphaera sp.]|nr:hypothetical protein [Humisphaera sp.]
ENWTTQDAIHCLRGMANSRPLGLEPSQFDAIAIIYLLDALARLLGEGYEEEQDVVSWHRQVLMRLSPRHTPRKEAAAA